MEILTTEDVCREYRLSRAFVVRNAAQMGARGRPRRFLRETAEAFLRGYHHARIAEIETRSRQARALVASINDAIEQGRRKAATRKRAA